MLFGHLVDGDILRRPYTVVANNYVHSAKALNRSLHQLHRSLGR